MFEYITNDFKVDWNFDDIIHAFGEDVYHGDNLPVSIYDNRDQCYFQTFYSKVSTSMNFSKFFPEKSQELLSKIQTIQVLVRDMLDKGNIKNVELATLFVNKNIHVRDILFLRMDVGVGASPHVDRRRTKALNIGFQNSNCCTTYFRPDKKLDDFWENPEILKKYTLQDGEVYLMDVGYAHSVVPNENATDDEKRYIITVNLDSNSSNNES
jgi:hypothetical protein